MKKEKTLKQHVRRSVITIIGLLVVAVFLTGLSQSIQQSHERRESEALAGRVLDPGDVEFIFLRSEERDHALLVHRSDTLEERQLGLSGVMSLSENHGMLFVFPEPGFHSFWMKDMYFPLDIVWANEDGQIVYLMEDVQPETYPSSFAPMQEALYVLEVPAGFMAEYGFTVGDLIVIEGM